MKSYKYLLILFSLIIFSCESATEPKDCADVAGGTAVEDNCGTCDSDTANDCVQDCADVWGGTAIEDCAGVCGGTAVEDECGVCDSDTSNDCVQDCANVWGGDAFENECGCVGGSTGLDADHCYPCVDIDGNQYQTILMNGRVWMAENLKVTHYNNGDVIPTEYSDTDWGNLLTGAYAVYEDDPSNADTYGNLYNWHAVGDEKAICPEGWVVPSGYQHGIFSDELNNYFGSNAGGKMKECTEGSCPESEYWSSPNTEATNESGFTGLPSGWRSVNGSYDYMGSYAFFWTSTAWDETASWSELQYNANELRAITGEKELGLAIRCVYGINSD